ncbi:MAG: HAD family phosphatase [Streptococcaceae bacterium]|jgi:HAD superfamily hydrolase (TIGR01509 family)|nr:HAD family phosphatase [Streptococcaceae bacterium]
MRTQSIKCVIFDLDGTLVDTENIFIEGYRRAFERRKLTIELSEIQSWVGKSAESTLEKIDQYTNHRYLSEIIRMERIQYFRECFEQRTLSLRPYAKDILDFCKTNGLKIGLATSTPENFGIEILNYFGIFDAFDFIVFGDHVNELKPAPDVYNRAVSRSGIARGSCLAVEDSESGVDSALAAKLKVVQVVDMSRDFMNIHKNAMKHLTSLDQLKLVLMEIDSNIKIFA